MPYISVADFKYGMDRRRPQIAGLPGTLWTLKNAVITRGGDIERCKKWVEEYELPSGTFGLAGLRGLPYVFGKSASAPVGLPSDISYLAIAHGGGAVPIKVHDAKPFDGKMYVISEWDDGNIRHHYDGTEITTEWTTLADAAFSYSTVAAALAKKINAQAAVKAQAIGPVVKLTANVPGTAFTLSANASDVDTDSSAPTATAAAVTANVAAVAEVRADGTITITGGTPSPGVNRVMQITIDGNDLLPDPVNFTTSNTATAAAISNAINAAAVEGYTASTVDNVITILAPPGLGATINGSAFTITAEGDVTTSSSPMADGVTAVEAVAQVSTVTIGGTTPDSTDLWSIVLNGTTYQITGRGSAMPLFCYVAKRRVWAPIGSTLRYSELGDATVWSTTNATPSTDPGFIELSSDTEGADDLTSLANFLGNTAIFSESGIRVYALNTDAEHIEIVQSIDNTGSLSPFGTVPFGATDVFYFDISGPRSLRTRSGTDAAFATDIGSPIDTYVQEIVAAVGLAVASTAKAVIDPQDGRYMLVIGSTLIVLSFFPGAQIAAWSEIELEFEPDHLVRVGRRVMARDGDSIYVYGGLDGDTYPDEDEYEVDAITPFLSASDPANRKSAKGFDMAGEGTWEVTLLVDPNDTTKTVSIGYVDKITYPLGAVKNPGFTSHMAVRFQSRSAGRCSLSSFAVHFEKGEAA